MTADNTITITLDDVLGPDGLDGAWEEMTRKLTDRVVSKFTHVEDGRSFHKACIDAITTAVQERIAARIDAMMDDPIQPTNGYGEPSGPATTLKAMIASAIDAAATEKVDTQGRPDRHGATRIEHAMREITGGEVQKAVRAEVVKLKQEAKQKISEQIAKAITASIQA